MQNVTINGKQFSLHYTFRGLFIYEEITGETYNDSRTMNKFILLYAMLTACNPNTPITLDEIVAECDKSMTLMNTFNSVLEDYVRRMSELADCNDDKKKENL